MSSGLVCTITAQTAGAESKGHPIRALNSGHSPIPISCATSIIPQTYCILCVLLKNTAKHVQYLPAMNSNACSVSPAYIISESTNLDRSSSPYPLFVQKKTTTGSKKMRHANQYLNQQYKLNAQTFYRKKYV